jgi:hypothetical protein
LPDFRSTIWKISDIVKNHYKILKLQATGCMFSSYVEYRPNTNIAILRKTGHTNGRSLTGEGGWKKEVKKVNMVDVLPVQEWILDF